MTLHTKVGGAWKTIADGNLWVKDGGTWRNTSLETKVGGVWKPIHTASDPKTLAIPATYTRSFRSSAGGSTGAWISSGFTNGGNALRQGKYGGKGAYLTLASYPGGGSYVSACYPNTYGWVGVMQFSGDSSVSAPIYDITDGWGSAVALTETSLADEITARPAIKGTPSLHIQRVNTASNAGQTGGEGFATASGNIYVAEYNALITSTTPYLSSISTSNQQTYNPGGSWLSRGEKVEINLNSTIVTNIKDSQKNLCVYAEVPTNTNDQGLRNPDNHGSNGNECSVYADNSGGAVPAAASQPNYVWYYDYSTGIADPSSGTVSGPWIEVQLDFV